MNKGKIRQIIGPIVDVEFPQDQLPGIMNALHIQDSKKGIDLTLEVAVHIGDNLVRCVAMSSTDGLVRDMDVVDSGAPITVPVGPETLGRIFNVLGHTLDDGVEISKDVKKLSIHRESPSFEEQESSEEQFETGIKVIDLLCPFSKGG